MNSQFRNSNLGFILYASIIGLILSATIFVIWYMTLGYKLGTYETDTRLGSVYIGGLTKEEVFPRMEEKIDYWYIDETIVFELKYQAYTYEFDRLSLIYDLEVSTSDITQGQTNSLLVKYQSADRLRIEEEILSLPFLANIIDNVDVRSLINAMLYDASLMKSYSCKNVEDFLIIPEDSIEEIGMSSFSIPEGVQIDDVIDGINAAFPADLENEIPAGRINVSSKSLFEVIDVLGAYLDDAEMTVLSSAMLSTILETNFLINEVHYEPSITSIGYTIENFPYYARNSVINSDEAVNESFSFYNPNASDYYFTVEKVDEFSGELRMYGLPFNYDIEIVINNTELDYISQGTKDVTLLQNGYNGAIIEVERMITDIYGNIIYNDVILFEFYPPTKEIIFEP